MDYNLQRENVGTPIIQHHGNPHNNPPKLVPIIPVNVGKPMIDYDKHVYLWGAVYRSLTDGNDLGTLGGIILKGRLILSDN